MSDMKCPFCNRNLHKGEDGIYSHLDYMTECKGRLFDGSKELWQELIRTRKALDVAIRRLDQMTWGCDSTDAEHLLKEIKEITAPEQKD